MLTLNEAIDRLAARVLDNSGEDLIKVYYKYPTRTNRLRRTLCHAVEHAIHVRVSAEVKLVRAQQIYPITVENMPAITRIIRKVFDGIVKRTATRESV